MIASIQKAPRGHPTLIIGSSTCGLVVAGQSGFPGVRAHGMEPEFAVKWSKRVENLVI